MNYSTTLLLFRSWNIGHSDRIGRGKNDAMEQQHQHLVISFAQFCEAGFE